MNFREFDDIRLFTECVACLCILQLADCNDIACNDFRRVFLILSSYEEQGSEFFILLGVRIVNLLTGLDRSADNLRQ